MKTVKASLDQSFTPFFTFIEYQNKIIELETTLRIKETLSIKKARKLLDNYIKPHQKLSDDILKMREE